MAESNPGVLDRISELTEPLLHHILSFLPVTDAARTSILSKRWNYIWSSLPYLNLGEGFLDDDFYPDLEGLRKNKLLLELANNIILYRCKQIASIEKLCLRIPEHEESLEQRLLEIEGPGRLDCMVDRIISSVAPKGLKELEFKIYAYTKFRFYKLPSAIFSAKSLNVLSLHGFDLSSLSSFDVKFPSLRKLCLSQDVLEDGIIGKLIAGSPLLENMQLIRCNGLRNIFLRRLRKLQVFELISHPKLYIIDIEAPNLQVLALEFPSFRCQVKVANCSSLSKLSVDGKFVKEKWFTNIISRCCSLENLCIGGATSMQNIRISTNTLKKFKLHVFLDLLKVEIDAPNLENFHFQGDNNDQLPSILLNASDLLEIKLDFFSRNIDDCWNSRLAEFMGFFRHFKAVKLYGDTYEAIIIPKENRVSLLSPLYGTHKLIFHAGKLEFVPVELIEYMLWLSPRAESLLITREDDQNRVITNTVLKFFYVEKVYKDTLCPCCKLIDCWHHCLIEIRIEEFERDEDEMTKMKDFFSKNVKNLKIEGLSSIAH